MGKYEVEIVESVSYVFNLEADSRQEAYKKAMKIHKGEIKNEIDEDNFSEESIGSVIQSLTEL